MLIDSPSEADGSPLFSFVGVKAWYGSGDPVLKSGSMEVRHGTVVGLVGDNGAGKTTLVNAVCGVHRRASFEDMRFEGKPCSPSDVRFKRNRYAGFAQDRSFRFWSLAKLMEFVERVFPIEREEGYRDSLLRGFGLEGVLAERLGSLSDGQRKKAALCAAFYSRRPLLLLDEPVDFLDFSSTEFLYEAMPLYALRFGSIIMCSHVAESITRCCSQLYSLEDGVVAGPFEVPENPEDVSYALSGRRGRWR